ncbi:TRAP transporter, DctM subunit [Hoeflea sp. IMCC20628]|uniref:TRAP transporter large permease n=1 Tax=Hoeflea sp. IMCC20628 TaxID=1620421 RepID=UPI00063A9315|nr:TRAP transporter large permease [Hoeflea sp. IMCC20628]AKH98919.1 TRAP transporter, DctM subunit [Hoeflea sp. IMCC20628]
MEPLTIGLIAMAGMLLLIMLGIPISFALLAVGAIGMFIVSSSMYAETQLLLNLMEQGTNFSLLAIPLYLLMGQLVYRTGLAGDLYSGIYRWIGRLPGGLAVASILAAAGFGAVSGGSATAVATLGPMCMPEMRKFNYHGGMSAASIAIAGTLGILIPPSIFMIAYGIWTETSIGALFLAGIVPGIILAIAYSLVIVVICTIKPEMGPVGERFSWAERFSSLVNLAPILLIFGLIVGGIYGGIFDPTEAAAIGVVGVLIISLVMGRLNIEVLRLALVGTSRTSMMIFMILLGGHVISRFLVLTNISSTLVDYIVGLGLGVFGLLALLTLMYIVLGMILDIWAMLILTIPFVFPVIVSAGIDPVWFGVYIIIMCELAAITPPIGLNVYIMARVAPEVPVGQIFLGIVPFFFTTLFCLVIFTIWPEIVTALPTYAFQR